MQPAHAARLELTQALLAARHRHVAPLIPAMTVPGDVRFDRCVLARALGGRRKEPAALGEPVGC